MRSYAKIVKRFYDAKVCQRINGIRKVTQDMAHMERVIMGINGSGTVVILDCVTKPTNSLDCGAAMILQFSFFEYFICKSAINCLSES
jgi:hypothetical protein